jgi:hypothetical protein
MCDDEVSDLGLENDNAEDEDRQEQEEWMRIQQNIAGGVDVEADVSEDSVNYWAGLRAQLSDEILASLDDWIAKQKKDFVVNAAVRPIVSSRTLRRGQRRAYNVADRSLTKEQLLMRLEGTAGIGKSHVINTICNLLRPDEVFVAAPTGKAANGVGGVTLHSLLHLMNSKDLTGAQLRLLQTKFKTIRYLIVNEYSMVGCKLLKRIDSRLRQAKCKPHELFGGISILLCGDFKQLPPVADTCLWFTEVDGMVQPRPDDVRDGLIAFKTFKTVVVLTEIVRQEGPDQVEFRECFSKFRLGQVTKYEYNLLLARNTFKHCAR